MSASCSPSQATENDDNTRHNSKDIYNKYTFELVMLTDSCHAELNHGQKPFGPNIVTPTAGRLYRNMHVLEVLTASTFFRCFSSSSCKRCTSSRNRSSPAFKQSSKVDVDQSDNTLVELSPRTPPVPPSGNLSAFFFRSPFTPVF